MRLRCKARVVGEFFPSGDDQPPTPRRGAEPGGRGPSTQTPGPLCWDIHASLVAQPDPSRHAQGRSRHIASTPTDPIRWATQLTR